jgi:hypothetical protein
MRRTIAMPPHTDVTDHARHTADRMGGPYVPN